MNNTRALPSPCIRNCCLDENDICLGCFRSLEEIGRWSQTDDNDRQAIIDNCKRRRQNRLAAELPPESGFSQ